MVHCIYQGVSGYNFQKNVFLSLLINFVSANSADPDEMPPYVAFHLDLHCLQKYLQGVSGLQRINCLYFMQDSLIILQSSI